ERIGNPIRYTEKDILIKSYARNVYGFSANDKVVGIILGSQGAKRVNEIILEGVEKLLENYRLVWVTGQDYYDMVFEKCKRFDGVKVFPFINDVNVFMSAIDIAISRAGASTLSELSFFGVPSVIIPFPYASRNHQYYNALFFESRGAGVLIDESEASIDKILSALEFIFRNIDVFKSNVKRIFQYNVNDIIVSRILEV
ncbi:MAG: UDP-N-acetylglucosamine--N-acetylmuramyl-(pentapeptide) pyrophosphoryl-undecaprenol N-acetylglucosamine transferase, partial [Brevinematia bacterium]